MSITFMILIAFCIIVYLSIGYIITRKLIKSGTVETATDFWFFLTLWLWIIACVCIMRVITAIFHFPKKFAEKIIDLYA